MFNYKQTYIHIHVCIIDVKIKYNFVYTTCKRHKPGLRHWWESLAVLHQNIFGQFAGTRRMDDTEVYIVVARQKALADELTKLKINFKKDGLGRKTSKYKSDRLQRLEAIWQEFVTTISESSSTSKRIHHMSLGTYQKGFILLIAILRLCWKRFRPMKIRILSHQPQGSWCGG